MERGNARLHMYYTETPDAVAALRAELDGAEVYHRTFAVALSPEQTAADLRSELARFRREYNEQGWEELPPFLRLQDEA